MLRHLLKGQFHFSMRQMDGSLIFLKWYYHKYIQPYLALIHYIDIFLKAGQKSAIPINNNSQVYWHLLNTKSNCIPSEQPELIVSHAISCLSHNMQHEGHNRQADPSEKCLPMKQYYCSQRALGSCRFCVCAQSMSFNVAEVFYITVPFSCVWTIFPGSASFGRPTAQFVCSHRVCLSGNKGGQPGHCVLLCPICQESVAQTMKRLQRATTLSLSVAESLSLSCRNHNSNYKSCLVSR